METKLFQPISTNTPAHHEKASIHSIDEYAQALANCSRREARELLDYDRAVKLGVLPLGVIALLDGNKILSLVACRDDRELRQALRFITDLDLRITVIDQPLFEVALFKAYHGDDQRLVIGVSKLKSVESQSESQPSPLAFRPSSGEAANFLASLIEYAIARQASDIHLTPRIDGTYVKLRLKRQILSHDQPICSLSLHRQLINRLKILSHLDTTEQNRPQDGAFEINEPNLKRRIRVSLMPSLHGERAVLRLAADNKAPLLDHLGFSEQMLARIRSTLSVKDGLILLAGPTGSGKTTTLYACVNELLKAGLNISSVEDPVEIEIAEVSQTSLDERRGLTYPKILRSLLRQDPDVMMIGEIRDVDSARITCEAALTGHLVLSSVHAHTTREVLLRLHRLGVDSLTVAQTLRAVCAQRLIPTLCAKCKVIDLALSQQYQSEVCRKVGCEKCDYSGYDGVALAAELFLPSEEFRELLYRKEEIPNDFWKSQEEMGNFFTIEQQITRLISTGVIAAQ